MTFLFFARLFAYATIFAVGGDPPVLIGRLGTLVGAISVGAADLPGLDDRRWRGARAAEGPLLVRRCARGCRRPRLVVAVARLRSTVFPGCPRRAPINCSAMPAMPSMTARKSVRPETISSSCISHVAVVAGSTRLGAAPRSSSKICNPADVGTTNLPSAANRFCRLSPLSFEPLDDIGAGGGSADAFGLLQPIA